MYRFFIHGIVRRTVFTQAPLMYFLSVYLFPSSLDPDAHKDTPLLHWNLDSARARESLLLEISAETLCCQLGEM